MMSFVLSKLDFIFHPELKTDEIKPSKEHAKRLNYIHMYTLSQTTIRCIKKLLYLLRKGIACMSCFTVFTKNKVNQIWMQNTVETSNIHREYLFSPAVILAK